MRGIVRTLILGLAVAATAAGTGRLDSDGDGVPDVDDCAPGDASIWAPPPEPVDDLMLSRSGTGASLAWSPPADVGGVPGSERYVIHRPPDFSIWSFSNGEAIRTER